MNKQVQWMDNKLKIRVNFNCIYLSSCLNSHIKNIYFQVLINYSSSLFNILLSSPLIWCIIGKFSWDLKYYLL